MNVLHRLGKLNGTDKVNADHSFAGETYMEVYFRYFDPIRERTKCILELGVFQGASLKTWRDFFPFAEVWGVDIDPKANQAHGPRIHIVTGSQVDPAVLAKVAPGKLLDIVVDDGSHLIEHMISSFELLWPRVKPGGIYAIEDLRMTYCGNIKNNRPGVSCNPPDTNFFNERSKMDAFLGKKIRTLDECKGSIRTIQFWPMQIIFQKVL